MTRRLVISALGVTMIIATLVVAGSAPLLEDFDLLFVAFLFAGLWVYAGLGVIIIARAQGHVVGWLFAIAATMMALAVGSLALGYRLESSEPAHPLIGWVALLGSLLWAPAPVLLLPAVALIFPTGTLPGPRWRWPVALIAALVVMQVTVALIRPGPLTDSMSDNPLTPWLPPVSERMLEALRALEAVGRLALPLAAGLGVAAILIRFRRSHGGERQQLKWFLAAVVPATVLLPVSVSEVASSPLIDVLSVASLPVVGLSIAIAILRYRLYEIDRLISRGVSWAVLSGLLLAVYGGAVLLLQTALGDLIQGQTVAVAGSTLLAAALFQPLRRRIQVAVDHRFNRARYDAERTATDFAERLRDEVDLPALRGDFTGVVDTALHPSAISVWIRRPRSTTP